MVLRDQFSKYQEEFSHYTEQGYRVLVLEPIHKSSRKWS